VDLLSSTRTRSAERPTPRVAGRLMSTSVSYRSGKGSSDSILASISRVKLLRKFVGKPFLRLNEWTWNRLPCSVKALRSISLYGTFLHTLVGLRAERSQYHGTFFLRNRPQLELIRSLAGQKLEGSTLKIAVLACSNGAEVYSILWTIRSARPDLKLDIHAIDISDEILEIARKGVYSLGDNPMVHSAILERLTEAEMAALFDEEKDQVRIKPWIAEGIHWMVGDAAAPNLADHFGPADIVVANNFLCHMAPPDAERCLRNLARLVKPGGYLFASGIDLDVRTRVAIDLGWTPVLDRPEGIHNGDPSLRRDWPWKYWGLEPFDAKRSDWRIRYAAAFQLGSDCRLRKEVCF
jgi:SAM-dependent methyltransferase